MRFEKGSELESSLARTQRRLRAAGRWCARVKIQALTPLLLFALAAPGFEVARQDYAWSFPRDHFAHRGFRTEWWYFTGHLDTESGEARRFGYQVTLFRIALLERRPSLESDWATASVAMGHAALSDLDRKEHRFSETVVREIPLLAEFGAAPGPSIARVQAPPGTDAAWTIRWNGAGFDLEARDDSKAFRLSLTTRAAKPLALQGPNGYSRKGGSESGGSQYYSFTRLDTRGALVVDGRAYTVRGESWMDQEFGSSQLAAGQVGWDWFALRLDDGRDLMLYVLRERDGRDGFRNGTRVAKDGAPRYLAASEWSVRARSSWTSAATRATYPSGWTIEIPSEGLSIAVEPDFPEQENVPSTPRAPTYWEGSVTVRDASGRPVGRGFVELTGYGDGNRPPV